MSNKFIQLTDASNNNLYPKPNYTRASYTPTIKWSGTPTTDMTVANIGMTYTYTQNTLFVSGRFQITSVGTPTSSIVISPPSGFTVPDKGLELIGFLMKPDNTLLHVRGASTGNFTVIGTTGGGAITSLATGYYLFEATVYGILPS